MSDFISLTQFRTAVPFGYLFFFMFMVAVILCSLVVFFTAIRSRKYASPCAIISGVILLLSTLYFISGFMYSVNLSPYFEEKELVGYWEDGDARIHLKIKNNALIEFDEKYKSRFGIVNGSAVWRKTGDFNLMITDNGNQSAMFRVITYGEKYRLILEDYGDPDLWDGDLGFKREGI